MRSRRFTRCSTSSSPRSRRCASGSARSWRRTCRRFRWLKAECRFREWTDSARRSQLSALWLTLSLRAESRELRASARSKTPNQNKKGALSGALPGLGCYRVAVLRSSPLRFIRTIHSEFVYLLPMNFRRPRNGVMSRAMTHLADVADRIDRSHTPRWWGGAGTGRLFKRSCGRLPHQKRIARETAADLLYCSSPSPVRV